MAIREIHSLIDSHPVVNEHQLKLWEWISFYYLSSPGDVYKAALPSPMIPADLKPGFKPWTESFIRLHSSLNVKSLPGIIGRAKKQQALLDEISLFLSENKRDSISRKEISGFSSFSPSVLNGLLQKQILETFDMEKGRIVNENMPLRKAYPLSELQQKALNELNNCFNSKQTCLLHGVTSSGKTEIYIHLIDQFTAKGEQTLYLLPEIALTAQLTQRLKSVFGNKIGIYHSKINDNERTEIWQKMLSEDPYMIILGARSSLFLPFQRLGLVIVDEEHETGYKQQDPSPRYHARDTAIMLAHIYEAKTVLGSATPSIESYYNAMTGKYGLVTIKERFNSVHLPEIDIQNTKELRMKRKMKSLLAPDLIKQINNALDNGGQVILFRNRRGFASLIECKLCAWTPKCTHCDVSLTYHKLSNRLVCHYCNTSYPVPSECHNCGEKSLKPLGQGTEQLEEEVNQLFPGAVVARMDMDTTRGKDSYERIIKGFEEKQIDILVGTQMLSKGLDFDNVNVVGIISADSLLNYPDFRSHERGFQLMMQAAGRAGRKNKQGLVIIQSAHPGQPIYRYLLNNDYESFFRSQLTERKLFNYPPYSRIICIIFKHRNEKIVEKASAFFTSYLKQSLQERVLGPNKPIVSRIQMYHIRETVLKLEAGLSPKRVRDTLNNAEKLLREEQEFKYSILYYDVDPL